MIAEPYDVAIVLGAGLPAMRRRVAHAAALVHAGRVRRLLMTGGAHGGGEDEAAVMRRLALDLGVDDGVIFLERKALDTLGNAAHCLPIVRAQGWRRVMVVSDAYHLPRARYVFRRLGLPVAASAAPRRLGAGWLAAALREAAALPLYLLRVERARSILRGRANWGGET